MVSVNHYVLTVLIFLMKWVYVSTLIAQSYKTQNRNSPNVIFNFWMRDLFLLGPTVTSAVRCWHELLPCAGSFASFWQNCSHIVYPCPPHVPLKRCYGPLAFLFQSLISCRTNYWLAPLDPVTFTVHLFWEGIELERTLPVANDRKSI